VPRLRSKSASEGWRSRLRMLPINRHRLQRHHRDPLNSAGRQITGLHHLRRSEYRTAMTSRAASTPTDNFYSIAGGNGNTTLWRLDGGDNQDYMANGNMPFPFPMREPVQRGVNRAWRPGRRTYRRLRQRRHPVGHQHYHGSAFEFIRNNIIDATNFYSVTPTRCTKMNSRYLGGPILHDKLFAFAGYQRLNYTKQQASTKAFVRRRRT